MIKKLALAATTLALTLVPTSVALAASTAKPKPPAVVAVSKVTKGVKVCTGAAVARKDIGSCVSLYLRPASWNRSHTVYTPAGPALVAECLDQYHGAELHYCLTQPVEK